ncbi:MAG: ATP-dependent transcriptional regulator [Candidatus Thorarchaeota archaeon]|nr:MAG: ATP-dependent transcriptional regulator [Candidatus Thorarchaeota archaeon]
METLLLQTKLYVPLPRPDLVARSRLVERLDEGLTRKLILVSAPAGFGKTTLLGTWLRQIDAGVGWLSLDEKDNDPTRFLRYLGAALTQAAPDLVAPPPGGPSTSFEAVLVPLINQLAERIAPLVLVFDDYHLVANPTIDEALVFLIDNAPPTLHLVVATRADPSFPLPRWRARRQLLEIRADDLRFTPDETAAFLRATLDLELNQRDLAALDAQAEGWIAALQLVAISLRGQADASSFVEALSGSHRHVLDYLVQEVLQRQAPAVRSFLLRTSILERFSAALCDGVLDADQVSARQVLAQLEQDNLFLVPMDDQRRWYRYHRLFRDFLRARLEMERPDLAPVLHRRAARWYAENDTTDDAVHHALAAGDHELAATLIASAYPSMLQQGEVATLKRWVEALPVSLRRSDPALMLAHAWTRVVTLDVDDMEDCLADLEELVETKADLTPEERAAGRGEILTLRTSHAFSTGDMEATIEYAEQALAQLPEADGVVRSVVAQNLGNAYDFLGQLEAASEAFARAIAEGHRSGNHFLALSARFNLGELRRLQGRWHEAEALYREGLAWVEAHQAQPLGGLMHVGLGLIHWDRWEVDAARHHLEVGARLSRRIGAHIMDVMASSALACLARHQGDEEEALGWLERTMAVSRRLNYAEVAGFAKLWEMRCRIARGDRGALVEWMAHRRPLDRLSADTRAFQAQVVAHARLALDDAQGTLDDLASVREQTQASGWTRRRVEVLALEAQALEALGNRSHALAQLEAALELSRPGRFVRPFVEAGESVLAENSIRHPGRLSRARERVSPVVCGAEISS